MEIIKSIVAVALLLCMLIVVYLVAFNNGRAPVSVFSAPPNDPNYLQWRKNWRQASDSLVNVTAVAQTDQQLLVYVDYIYSGSAGETATTCGGIIDRERVGAGAAPL